MIEICALLKGILNWLFLVSKMNQVGRLQVCWSQVSEDERASPSGRTQKTHHEQKQFIIQSYYSFQIRISDEWICLLPSSLLGWLYLDGKQKRGWWRREHRQVTAAVNKCQLLENLITPISWKNSEWNCSKHIQINLFLILIQWLPICQDDKLGIPVLRSVWPVGDAVNVHQEDTKDQNRFQLHRFLLQAVCRLLVFYL